ncbi:hypothetical protein [Streptobacillus moniliformis]|uniref:hypothetical protein n=1 Tax=Streptobacillus moniliformis TaxID=34105 RepID=UPI0007E444E4|nr:hypothetical protein [Streptobacillus moniliformis]
MDKITLQNTNGKQIDIKLDDIDFIECVVNNKAFLKTLIIAIKNEKITFSCINNQDINEVFYNIFRYLKNKRGIQEKR